MHGQSAGPRILLVEDHPRMRAMIRSVVSRVAADVIECADGHEAVRLHTSFRPDIVLMDIEIPGLDGLSATRAIRRKDAGARIVVVTEHDNPGFRQAAESAGAWAYVLKDQLLELPAVVLRCYEGIRDDRKA